MSAVNYATAKATLLTKSQAKGKDGYRSTELYLRQSELGNVNQVIMCILINACLGLVAEDKPEFSCTFTYTKKCMTLIFVH